MSEKSLRLAAIVGRTEAGVELFLKHNRLKTDKAPYVIARRKRNALKIPNAGVEVNDPWSHKIYEFGVKGWHRTGTSSSNVAGVTPTVQGALIFVEKELFSTWVMLDSDGILPVLDSKLNRNAPIGFIQFDNAGNFLIIELNESSFAHSFFLHSSQRD